MSDFLTSLANQIEDSFSLGENQNNSLDIIENGTVKRYGKLGDFASKFDQSAQRKYLEEGYLRKDNFNVDPKLFEVLWQEPNITVLVKKRAFSTLSENYRSDFMDEDEKLYFKASKILFQNKCRQISAFEKLCKIERVSAAAGQLDDQLIPLIITLSDTVGDTLPSGLENAFSQTSISDGFKKLNNVIDKVRKIYAFRENNAFTTWVADQTNLFKTDFAQGTGVIELTNITNLSTNTTTNFGGGSFSFNIVDPYNLMRITNSDIERALADANNIISNNDTFQLGQDSIDKIIAKNIKRLNDVRQLRGASNIEFIINPDTFLGKKVRAIIEKAGVEINFTYDAAGGLGELVGGGVNIDPNSFRGGSLVGDEGLNTGVSNNNTNNATGSSTIRLIPNSEVSLFADIINSIFTSLQLKKSAENRINSYSQNTNYVRKKLRFHYGNKCILQPMDQVRIFITSKTRTDDKLVSGLRNMFTGLGFFQNLNNNVYDLKNQFTTLFNPSANVSFQQEKFMFVGSDFPNNLWALMRNIFVDDKSGAHVFAGIIEDANREFSAEGLHRVAVSGKDHTEFFRMGIVNLQPGVDAFNGPLYDPLTPFQTKFDTVSSNFKNQHPPLLKENQELLAENLLKYKAGRNAGINVSEDNFFSDKDITKRGQIRNVIYAPDGLVYKWKEGIGTLVQFGDSFNSNFPETISTPSITQDPFAGQDIMNVLSLLITGEPYNYATYFKAVREFDSFGRDPQTNQDASSSFYKSLSGKLSKRNLLWGNFIPFKHLTVDEKTFENMLNSQLSVVNANLEIDNTIKNIQDLQNQLIKVQQFNDIPGRKNAQSILEQRLSDLKRNLTKNSEVILQQLKNSNSSLFLIGNDVSYDADALLDTQNNNQLLTDPQVRRELRRKINFLTRRLSWSVRANEDKNLLIVDDSYDKDYDIIAFEKQLRNIEQYSSEYTTVAEKISSVANLLDLEVFCDTQGHLRIRPKQYNRMPSSIFYAMINLKQQNNVQLFPQFLEDLFVDQINALIRKTEIVEDEIRLLGATLGKSSDSALIQFIRGSNADGGSAFDFISNQQGEIANISSVSTESNPDEKLSGIDNTLGIRLENQLQSKSIFNNVVRAQAVNTIFSSPNQISTTLSSDKINELLTRLTIKTGQGINLDNITERGIDGNLLATSNTNNVDVFKATKQLAEKIAERQKIIKSLNSAIKNAEESRSLDNDSSTANKLLFPSLYGNKEIPEIFENLIEDETYDDYGPGSGKRYIIKNYQVISLSIKENPPKFTSIEVQGQLDPFIGRNDLPAGLNSFKAFGSGGNGLITAAAVDYDTWRMYGFRNTPAVQVPFLSDPQNQCAPYAASLLSRARKEILTANITIVGNEFMQPGEVVYIEDEGLLFYVENVNHSFTYGSSFTTSLTLTYGHNPGEYIPTPIDTIGKLLYNNRDTSSYINYRQINSANENALGALIIDRASSSFNAEDAVLGGNRGEYNLKVINDIIYSSKFLINGNTVKQNNFTTSIDLRIFHQGTPDSLLEEAAESVKKIITGKSDKKIKSPLNTDTFLNANDVKINITFVNTSDNTNTISPSQKALDLCRDLSRNNNFSTNTGLKDYLFGYIIDCVAIFNNV